MKQYKNNLEIEEDQAPQSLIQKHQVENYQKESKEEVPNHEYQKSYRLNQIRDKKQNSIKQQLDALSTATSNFYKESNENQIKSPSQLIESYKKIDQSQITQIKQQRMANRIISAQPLRHLVIKKGQDSIQFQQFENQEQKRPLVILKGLSDKYQRQEENETIPDNQLISSDLNQQIFKRASRLRKKSQSNGFYISQNSKQEEPQIDSELVESFKEQMIINQSGKINKDELYDSLEIETIQNISKMEESEFDQITKIQFRFNAKEGSLYMLGELLINLQELILDYSNIESLRLLGTKLTFLQILSIKKSNLVDLSGILSMPNLVELNCSFNSINDVSPLAFHSKIAILNLEGNQLTDEYQLDHLESLNLQYLNIKKNPLCSNQKLYEIILQRFAHIKMEIEGNPIIIENTRNELKQNQKIEFQEQKINQEEQRIKQLQTLMNDIEQNQSLCESVKGKQYEKHKLRRPQTAQVQQIKSASPSQGQEFNPYNKVIQENFKDHQMKNQQIYSLKKPNF